jgi:uncharacterized membrane protein
LAYEGGSQRGSSSETTPRPRVQTLSDLIFGLALSISALTLIGHQPATAEQFFTSLGLYGFSFLILISVWRVYSSITSVLPSETPLLTGLNYVLLFLVSIEPYLFNELFASTSFVEVVNSVYAYDLAIMFLILAAFNHILASEERNLVTKSRLGRYRLSRNLCLLVAGVFVISTVPALGSTIVFSYTSAGATYEISLRSVLWIASLVVGWSRRLLDRTPVGSVRQTSG